MGGKSMRKDKDNVRELKLKRMMVGTEHFMVLRQSVVDLLL